MNQNKYALLSVVSLLILLLTLPVSLAQDASPDCTPSESDCPNTFSVNIPAGVNVRSIEAGSLGQADSTFPGNAEVVGWLDPAGSALAARDSGTWLVMMTADGEYRAVAARLVTQTDDTPVTDEEATTTPQFVYDGAGFGTEPDVDKATVTEEPTVEATAVTTFDPESVPTSLQGTARLYPADQDRNFTIEPNPDSAFMVTGPIARGQISLVDELAWNYEPDSVNGVVKAGMTGYIVGFYAPSDKPDSRYMTVAYETPNGTATMNVRIMYYVRLVQIDPQFNTVEENPDMLYYSSVRVTPTGIIIGDFNLEIGDEVGVIYDDPTNNQSGGGVPNGNRQYNGIADGQPSHILTGVMNGTLPVESYVQAYSQSLFLLSRP